MSKGSGTPCWPPGTRPKTSECCTTSCRALKTPACAWRRNGLKSSTTSANAGASNFTLTIPAVSGTAITTGDSNTVALGMIAQSGANTMLGNWSGSTANVAANAMPSCADTGSNHLNYVSGTGVTCGTSGGGSGALNLISTKTASNTQTTLEWTGLGSTYTNYLLIVQNLIPASNISFLVQVGTGAGPTYVTSGYSTGGTRCNTSATCTSFGSAASAAGAAIDGGGTVTSAGSGLTGSFTIINIPAGDTALNGTSFNGAATPAGVLLGSNLPSNSTAKTAIRIITSDASTNINTGTASLYGYSK